MNDMDQYFKYNLGDVVVRNGINMIVFGRSIIINQEPTYYLRPYNNGQETAKESEM